MTGLRDALLGTRAKGAVARECAGQSDASILTHSGVNIGRIILEPHNDLLDVTSPAVMEEVGQRHATQRFRSFESEGVCHPL